MLVEARRSSPVGELGATSQRARDLRPDSEGGRVTIGRAGGWLTPRHFAFDLGATPFAASGSGLPLLFGLLVASPAAPSLVRCGGAGRWAGLSAPSGVVFFEVAHSRLRYPRFKRWLNDGSGRPSESGHAIRRCAAVGS